MVEHAGCFRLATGKAVETGEFNLELGKALSWEKKNTTSMTRSPCKWIHLINARANGGEVLLHRFPPAVCIFEMTAWHLLVFCPCYGTDCWKDCSNRTLDKVVKMLKHVSYFCRENHVFIEGFLSSGIETLKGDSLTQSHLLVCSDNKMEASFY